MPEEVTGDLIHDPLIENLRSSRLLLDDMMCPLISFDVQEGSRAVKIKRTYSYQDGRASLEFQIGENSGRCQVAA